MLTEELKSHFSLLGLLEDSSLTLAETAFRKKILEAHPDRNIGEPPQESHEKAVKLNNAIAAIRDYFNRFQASTSSCTFFTPAQASPSTPQQPLPSGWFHFMNTFSARTESGDLENTYFNLNAFIAALPNFQLAGIMKINSKQSVLGVSILLEEKEVMIPAEYRRSSTSPYYLEDQGAHIKIYFSLHLLANFKSHPDDKREASRIRSGFADAREKISSATKKEDLQEIILSILNSSNPKKHRELFENAAPPFKKQKR